MANFLITLFNKAIKRSPTGDAYRTTQSPDKYVNNIAALNATNQADLTSANKLRKAQYAQVDALGNSTPPQ
jgi:hypothetical protein